MSGRPAYQRILLKLSGEIFAGDSGFSQSRSAVALGETVASISAAGVRVGVVIGGGNILRGAGMSADAGVGRAVGDTMGMRATVINALAFCEQLRALGLDARVLSALAIPQVCETHTRAGALEHLERGRVVIFAGGTGHPFLTTDTAAGLRAAEIGADLLVKATKVDGVYDGDPQSNPDAQRYDRIDYDDVLERRLGVMDATSIVICRDNKIPICVMDMMAKDAKALHEMVVDGRGAGTMIDGGSHD